MLKKINIAVIGATGYTGLDLINLLSKHPRVNIINLCATKNLGKKISLFDKRIKKKLPRISSVKKINWSNIDLVFLSLPNGEAQKIIKKTLLEIGAKEQELENIYNEAEKIENNSNQILDFTREIKNLDEEFKVKITESLWSIIYSDGLSDMYEDNFMRRLTGLLYLDKKIVGDIKERTKNKNK